MTTTETSARSETFAELFDSICSNVSRAMMGKTEQVRLATVCLVAEGHLLVEDTPGVGKTTLAKALAASVDCTFGRVQFTPDLLPADVVGLSTWNRQTGDFDFRPGPVFNNVVLGDEINRASPKTQSALLEAMAEKQVTVDGTTYPLSAPFFVVATQNPLDHDGTFPLPESQLDRFLMRISLGYPDPQAELAILNTDQGADRSAELKTVVTRQDIVGMSIALNRVHVAPALQSYLVELATGTRQHASLRAGVSPRATLALQRACRVLSASQGRSFVTPDDVKYLAPFVLTHRLQLTPEAQLRGATAAAVLDDVIRSVAVPSGSPRPTA